MKQHYSEADLLETYYTQPGASMPVMMHLADCGECAARYERLEKKVHGLTACAHEKPEAFWARQRISILRKIEARRDRSMPFARIAAAAVLVLTLGGVVTLRVSHGPSRPAAAPPTQRAAATTEDPSARPLEESPWESEQLSDLHSMVAWESWIDSAGDHPL